VVGVGGMSEGKWTKEMLRSIGEVINKLDNDCIDLRNKILEIEHEYQRARPDKIPEISKELLISVRYTAKRVELEAEELIELLTLNGGKKT
jgi:hypothetical protein